jgi:hypothetical protein
MAMEVSMLGLIQDGLLCPLSRRRVRPGLYSIDLPRGVELFQKRDTGKDMLGTIEAHVDQVRVASADEGRRLLQVQRCLEGSICTTGETDVEFPAGHDQCEAFDQYTRGLPGLGYPAGTAGS